MNHNVQVTIPGLPVFVISNLNPADNIGILVDTIMMLQAPLFVGIPSACVVLIQGGVQLAKPNLIGTLAIGSHVEVEVLPLPVLLPPAPAGIAAVAPVGRISIIERFLHWCLLRGVQSGNLPVESRPLIEGNINSINHSEFGATLCSEQPHRTTPVVIQRKAIAYIE